MTDIRKPRCRVFSLQVLTPLVVLDGSRFPGVIPYCDYCYSIQYRSCQSIHPREFVTSILLGGGGSCRLREAASFGHVQMLACVARTGNRKDPSSMVLDS